MQAAKERIVSDEPSQHVQDCRALVVHDRAEDTAVASDVTESIAEINRSLVGLLHAPSAELPQHVREGLFATLALSKERGKVLGEPFADPLLVIVSPSDCLAPPLVRELVRQEELRIVVERSRIVAPHKRCGRQGLIQCGEIARTVPPRQVAFKDRECEAWIRRVAKEDS